MYGLKLVTFFGTGTGTDTGYFQFLKYGYGTRTLTRTSGYGLDEEKLIHSKVDNFQPKSEILFDPPALVLHVLCFSQIFCTRGSVKYYPL